MKEGRGSRTQGNQEDYAREQEFLSGRSHDSKEKGELWKAGAESWRQPWHKTIALICILYSLTQGFRQGVNTSMGHKICHPFAVGKLVW